ncbi:MAG: S41 family peptidase [Vicinamibacterales bacterium]
MTTRTRLMVLAVTTPLVGFAVIGGLLGRASAGEGAYRHLQLFDDVMGLITSNYVEPVEVDKVMDGAMRGLAEGLDADSAFLTAAQVADLEKGGEGEADIGLELTRQYYLRVVAARDGSAAEKAGLRTGDYVRAIDGKPTRTMSAPEGMRMLRGAAGTTVKLTVIRGNAAEPHELSLARERRASTDVTGRLERPGIGYVRVKGFGPKVVQELASEIADLKKKGASKLVVDVRNTAEGDPMRGLDAARLFVATGTLGSREERGAPAVAIAAKAGDGKELVPIALLTTAGTAGAAELFAAALKDNKRAELFGERTLGRAGVQHLVKLPDGSGLWMTYARFLSPAGKPVHGAGVEPTVEVAEPDVEFGAPAPTSDPILEKALEQFGQRAAA